MLHGLRTALGKGNKRSGPVLPLVHPNLSGQTNNRLHRHLLDDQDDQPIRSTMYYDIGERDCEMPHTPADIMKEHMEARLGSSPPQPPRRQSSKEPWKNATMVETRLGSTSLMIQLDLDIMGPQGLSSAMLNQLIKQEQLMDLLRVQCNGIEVCHGDNPETPQMSARHHMRTRSGRGGGANTPGGFSDYDSSYFSSPAMSSRTETDPGKAPKLFGSKSSPSLAPKLSQDASSSSLPRRPRPRPSTKGLDEPQDKTLINSDECAGIVRGAGGASRPVMASNDSKVARPKRPMNARTAMEARTPSLQSESINSTMTHEEMEELEQLTRTNLHLQKSLSESLKALQDEDWSSEGTGTSAVSSPMVSPKGKSGPPIKYGQADQSASCRGQPTLPSAPAAYSQQKDHDHAQEDRPTSSNERCTVMTPPTASLGAHDPGGKASFAMGHAKSYIQDVVKLPPEYKSFSPDYLHAAAPPEPLGEIAAPTEAEPSEDASSSPGQLPNCVVDEDEKVSI
mmetsp:Transcript_51104/g.150690  ORF Transcript_51104/g.150690 Transcript_51104/m.150690 type:complete len:509 (+) Transcript_51104:48-1574(+)